MILALDIGGSKMAYGLVKNGKVFNFGKIKWQGKITPSMLVNKISETVRKFKVQGLKFKVVCLSIAGQVNKNGEVYLSANIDKKRTKIPLKKILEKKLKIPVFVENDANCFTLGEAVFGKGKKENFVVGLTIGTGIGGGIVIDQIGARSARALSFPPFPFGQKEGVVSDIMPIWSPSFERKEGRNFSFLKFRYDKKILKGKDGFAGEFGHMTLEVGGKKCTCGKRGCWEAYAAGRAMEELYFELTGKKKTTFKIKEEFFKKKSGEIFIVNETAQWLAIGMANLINILNPDLVVLGGGMTCFESFIKIALKNIKPWLLVPETKTRILTSKLREKAALLGAALAAQKNSYF